jgi:hypothetical protein
MTSLFVSTLQNFRRKFSAQNAVTNSPQPSCSIYSDFFFTSFDLDFIFMSPALCFILQGNLNLFPLQSTHKSLVGKPLSFSPFKKLIMILPQAFLGLPDPSTSWL